ncbi:MAG: NFACT RNA binding domain-containing protein [Gemmatimonadaceae bacterium]
MDSLTAFYLARELHARWNGRRIAVFKLHGKPAGVTLGTAGSDPIHFDLSRPDVVARSARADAKAGQLEGYAVLGVEAPVDDRRLLVRLKKAGRFRGSVARSATLEISSLPSARGAVLLNEGGHGVAHAGSVPPPLGEPRPELAGKELIAAAAGADLAALLRGRWVSPRLARWLLASPEQIVDRYRRIADLPDPHPAWCDGQLYPFPICHDAVEATSLIHPETFSDSRPALAPDARKDRALERMRGELSKAANARALREAADALMTIQHLDVAPAEITLADGEIVRLSARQGEAPKALAERLYAEIRSMERAIDTLPGRIRRLEQDSHAFTSTPSRKRPENAPRRAVSYRSYRSSGGLEIRVGRGAKSNDQLTFREADPNDVWLHARGAAGAHVVLRWNRDERPPATDLDEAAQLAAWHSRSRGSAVVPVDWTRRKYVRKPRGGAPGVVVVERASTIMARPDAISEKQLRSGW